MTRATPTRLLRSTLMDEIEAAHGADALAAAAGGAVELAICSVETTSPFDPWCVLAERVEGTWRELGRFEEYGDAGREMARLLDQAVGAALTAWGSDTRPAIIFPCERGRYVLWRDDTGVRMSTQLANGLYVLAPASRSLLSDARAPVRVLTGLVDEDDLWCTFEEATYQLAVEADARG